jgi:NAD(P)-dependent dehydrogenase (short-subunit alcohol dehydrogenase family)
MQAVVPQDHIRPRVPVLSGKVAIVTGASSGIGRATAKLFAQEGASVVLAARRRAALDALVAEIEGDGGQAVAHAGDVGDEKFAAALVQTALRRFGRLDVAFNNAGTLGEMGAIPDISLQGWRASIETNLTGAFLAAKHQIPALLRQPASSLIFTSTFVGYSVGFPGIGAYAAAKAGVIGLMKTLAAEFGPKGVRVNAILPGATDTPMYRSMVHSEEAEKFIAGLNALKRIATPDEIAKSALYLASDASSFTTGVALLVDAGVSINRT